MKQIGLIHGAGRKCVCMCVCVNAEFYNVKSRGTYIYQAALYG